MPGKVGGRKRSSVSLSQVRTASSWMGDMLLLGTALPKHQGMAWETLPRNPQNTALLRAHASRTPTGHALTHRQGGLPPTS